MEIEEFVQFKGFKIDGCFIGQVSHGYIQNENTSEIIFAKVGERVGGAIVTAILEDKISLTFNNDSIELLP